MKKRLNRCALKEFRVTVIITLSDSYNFNSLILLFLLYLMTIIVVAKIKGAKMFSKTFAIFIFKSCGRSRMLLSYI